MKRIIIIITENKELYKSFTRALKVAGMIKVQNFEEKSLKNKKSVILISITKDKIHDLFYGKIRGKKHLNPVVVIGVQEKGLFEKEYPLFHDHPHNHAYIRIPFNLMEVVDSFKNMCPISSQNMRKAICGSDSGYKGYLLKMLSHDLLKDRERCLEILTICADYLSDKDWSERIDDAKRRIEEKENWSAVASNIGEELENRIKETCNV